MYAGLLYCENACSDAVAVRYTMKQSGYTHTHTQKHEHPTVVKGCV